MEGQNCFEKAVEEMNSQALVSVLMPAYNAEGFIAEAIQSIINQDHQKWELLILDDASTDSTKEVIYSFKDERIKVFSNEKNLGYLRSCNRLFELAKGDFITFLDADDTCLSNRLSACLQLFEDKPKVDFLTTDHIKFSSIDRHVHEQEVDHDRYSTDPTYSPILCCATIFVRSELLKQVGGYHRFFDGLGGEDYQLLFKLALNGNGKHLKQPLYEYRQHDAQFHLANNNPLKYFVQDIIYQIRVAHNSNQDLLTDPDVLLNQWQQYVASNPGCVYLRQASECINQSNSIGFWTFWSKSLWSKPHSASKFKQSLYLMYSYFARIA